MFSYTLTWTGPTTNIQELGWIFQMPANDYLFSWNRNGRWTYYPPGDICRASGTATPSTTNSDPTDMNLPNAFDFNSTKYNCNWASLTEPAGDGLRLVFSASQPFHCSAGATSNGLNYELIANQVVSPAADISSNIVPDLFTTLNNGDVVQGSFTVGGSSNLVSSGAAAINGPVSVIYPPPSQGNSNPVEAGFFRRHQCQLQRLGLHQFRRVAMAGPGNASQPRAVRIL